MSNKNRKMTRSCGLNSLNDEEIDEDEDRQATFTAKKRKITVNDMKA